MTAADETSRCRTAPLTPRLCGATGNERTIHLPRPCGQLRQQKDHPRTRVPLRASLVAGFSWRRWRAKGERPRRRSRSPGTMSLVRRDNWANVVTHYAQSAVTCEFARSHSGCMAATRPGSTLDVKPHRYRPRSRPDSDARQRIRHQHSDARPGIQLGFRVGASGDEWSVRRVSLALLPFSRIERQRWCSAANSMRS